MLAAIYNWYLHQNEDFSRLESLFSSDSRLCKSYYLLFPSASSVRESANIQYSNCKSKIIALNEYLHHPANVSRTVRYRNNHF